MTDLQPTGERWMLVRQNENFLWIVAPDEIVEHLRNAGYEVVEVSPAATAERLAEALKVLRAANFHSVCRVRDTSSACCSRGSRGCDVIDHPEDIARVALEVYEGQAR